MKPVKNSNISHQAATNTFNIQMAIHPNNQFGDSVQVTTIISTDLNTSLSTSVSIGTHQNRPRMPSRSRSKTPPLPSAMKPAFSRYRSRSQTLRQRQISGSLPQGNGQPHLIGFRRTLRVSSMGLTDGMKHLSLNDYSDSMEHEWENIL